MGGNAFLQGFVAFRRSERALHLDASFFNAVFQIAVDNLSSIIHFVVIFSSEV